jgi:hypothetical protein
VEGRIRSDDSAFATPFAVAATQPDRAPENDDFARLSRLFRRCGIRRSVPFQTQGIARLYPAMKSSGPVGHKRKDVLIAKTITL